jgi:hypothetical protein
MIRSVAKFSRSTRYGRMYLRSQELRRVLNSSCHSDSIQDSRPTTIASFITRNHVALDFATRQNAAARRQPTQDIPANPIIVPVTYPMIIASWAFCALMA